MIGIPEGVPPLLLLFVGVSLPQVMKKIEKKMIAEERIILCNIIFIKLICFGLLVFDLTPNPSPKRRGGEML